GIYRHGAPGVAPHAMTNTAQSLQRNLGNSYLQSIAESCQALGWASGQNGILMIQRKCACGGSCADCAGQEEMREIQTKLAVGPANDMHEQEADRVAAQIIRMPDAFVQTEGEQPDASMNIQRIIDGDSGRLNSAPDIELDESGGQPLSPTTRQFMEPRFGVD